VAHADLALFRAHPALRERLPRHPMLALPTPVEPLPLAGLPRGSVFVKRDERSCPLYGGNKPRKLEFVIGEALSRRARRVVTTGGLGTHHGLATAIAARSVGIATTLVLVRQPLTPEVRRSLLLHAAYGADLVYGGGVAGTALQVLRVLAAATARGERPRLVPTGGSSPLGNAGFVSAALELAEQLREGALPEPAELYVAVGTGGTLAGLLAGLRLAGLRTRVVGVLVTDILPPSPRGLLRAARATLARLRRADPSVPRLALGASDFELVRSQLGPGYGAATPAARAALEQAAACGLALETTYTAKCLAALLERLAARPRGPVLFWNTFNGVDVEARAPRPLDPALLPARFRRILAEPEAGLSGTPRGGR
jgi:D-cysteine desulfhydrase